MIRSRRRSKGQSLVEYGLLLALVALVAIVGLILLGTAVQRVYGVLTGAMGSKAHADRVQTIVIEDAACWVVYTTEQTGLYVTGTTDAPLDELTGSTNTQVGGPINPYGDLPGGFVFQPLLSESTANPQLCPQSVVVQSKQGAIAVAPLKIIEVR